MQNYLDILSDSDTLLTFNERVYATISKYINSIKGTIYYEKVMDGFKNTQNCHDFAKLQFSWYVLEKNNQHDKIIFPVKKDYQERFYYTILNNFIFRIEKYPEQEKNRLQKHFTKNFAIRIMYVCLKCKMDLLNYNLFEFDKEFYYLKFLSITTFASLKKIKKYYPGKYTKMMNSLNNSYQKIINYYLKNNLSNDMNVFFKIVEHNYLK